MNPDVIYRKLQRGGTNLSFEEEDVRITRNRDAFDIFVEDKLAVKMWRFGWLKLGSDEEASKAEDYLRLLGKSKLATRL